MQGTASGVTRRQFLHGLGAVGGAGAVYWALATLGLLRMPAAQAALPTLPPDLGAGRSAVVIGAGMAGLCAAYLLATHGFAVKVVEANGRIGGRSLTLRRGDRFAESDGPMQECRFTQPDLYWNAGPGRIPHHHTTVLDYCRRFGVRLEPFIFLCESNRLQNDGMFDGKPMPFRQVNYSLRGEIAELLAKVTQRGALDRELTGIDRQVFLDMLRRYGSLRRMADGSYAFLGTPQAGYIQAPGAGLDAGIPNPVLSLAAVLDSKFWQGELFHHLEYAWQSTLLQPVGGMDMIWRAFLRQSVPGNRTLQDLVTLASPVSSVRNTAEGVEIVHGAGNVETADFCVSTLAPAQLARIGQGFSRDFSDALVAFSYTPASKVGLESRTRFWEIEDAIYGGISWTRHDITQVWYPSYGFHDPTGVLTAAYNSGSTARVFGALALDQRIEAALEGGEKLHPGAYRRNAMAETALAVAWHRMPHFVGGWPSERNLFEGTIYRRLNEAAPEGRIYLAGDFISHWPAWQEGALAAAELAFKQIAERVARR